MFHESTIQLTSSFSIIFLFYTDNWLTIFQSDGRLPLEEQTGIHSLHSRLQHCICSKSRHLHRQETNRRPNLSTGYRQIGPRHIGPRLMGPLADLAANRAPHFFGAQFAILANFAPSRCALSINNSTNVVRKFGSFPGCLIRTYNFQPNIWVLVKAWLKCSLVSCTTS